MSLDTSNKILKVTGILSIIGGALMFVLGLVTVIGGGAIGIVAEAQDEAVVGGIAVFAGLMILFGAAVTLLEGIFSVRAAKDNSKINPAWIFAIIGLVSSIISMITNIANGGSIFSGVISLALSILIFVAANTIKNSR